MFGSEILDVIIGLVFVYLLASLICSALNECISRMITLRARVLLAGIRNLLSDSSIGEEIINHPLVKSLANRKKLEGKKWKVVFPSYMPSKTFALAMIDTMLEAGRNQNEVKNLSEEHQPDNVSTLQDYAKNTFATLEQWITLVEKDGRDAEANSDQSNKAQVMKSLRAMLTGAKAETKEWDEALGKFRTSIENWYDNAMNRVSGWYKRKAQTIIFCLALVIVGFFNLDSMMIADTLYHDSSARDAIVAMAAETASDETILEGDSTYTRVEYFRGELEKLPLPIGWLASSPNIDDPRECPDDGWGWFYKFIGLLFTAVAVSLGAPFWFDVLNKLMQLRASGKPEKKGEGVVEDTGGTKIGYVLKE